eukprot:5513197-Amphidinium_carterae.1
MESAIGDGRKGPRPRVRADEGCVAQVPRAMHKAVKDIGACKEGADVKPFREDEHCRHGHGWFDTLQVDEGTRVGMVTVPCTPFHILRLADSVSATVGLIHSAAQVHDCPRLCRVDDDNSMNANGCGCLFHEALQVSCLHQPPHGHIYERVIHKGTDAAIF